MRIYSIITHNMRIDLTAASVHTISTGHWPTAVILRTLAVSPLPPGFMGNLLHRREEILEDAARAEVDLGVDRHAGDGHVTAV